uniref:DUF4283 domain-containing protein n=1 Tax=Populus alba TaxID=43335 RepID=A0A4U5QD82_POPAL|nr:hypothetical protein D5086_0000103210 [Populus alba]
MAKNKRKATSTVARRQDASPVNIVSPKVNDHDRDSSGVLAPTAGSDVGPDEVACAPYPAPPPLPPSSPRYVGLPHPSSAMAVASGSRYVDVVLVEDCSVGSDDEILGEDQLDLNFSDEDCDSPQGPDILPAPILSSPLIPTDKVHSFSLQQREMPPAPTTGRQEPAPPSGAGNPIPGPSTSKWRDILFSNRSTTSCTKLQNYSLNHLSKTCAISHEDIQSEFEVWNFCAVGYIFGKNPGFKALNSIISTVWKTEATLTIHETGWLIYRFKSEEEKLAVLRGGPYLMYGRPLVLRPMTKLFDFSCEEMSRVPIWVKFPCLPLCCWSPICLSKIASVIGKPIQCDQLTSNLSRMSYARVLVEIDLLEELRHSVEITLPDGLTLHQKVVYETLPKYCNFCHVLAHTRILCSKTAASTNKVPCPQPQTQDGADRGNVFGRLGPQPPPQPPTVHDQSQANNIQQASEETATPEAALENSAGWVTMDSRKSSKQHKGKAIVGSDPVLDTNSPTPPTPPVCIGTVQHPPRLDSLIANSCVGNVQDPPHTPTAPLIVHSCQGEAHNSLPLATTAGNTIGVGNSVKVPLIGEVDQCGVRTRNQKQHSRSGRVFPSPANP